jgi:SAM-dependent methyltransferase
MSEEILVELAGAVERHPWWRARERLTLDLLKSLGVNPPARVLDAGCGWGVTLEALEKQGYDATGLDISRRALQRLDARRPGRRLIEADLTCEFPVAPRTFAAVLALDVIEHVDDDRSAVARLARLVEPGGWLVVSVPALPECFNEFDVIQGHRRRYTPELLRAAFDGSGLDDLETFWWGSWLVPLIRFQRRSKLAEPGEPAGKTYARYLALPSWPVPLVFRLGFALEHRRALHRKLRGGTSLFAIARKPH